MKSAQAPDVLTFGCRLNALESAAIARVAGQAGRSDAVIVNSCAVTSEAVKQARQAIRRVRRERPDVPVFLTGCAADTERAAFAAMPEVTRIVPNGLKTTAAAWQFDHPEAVAPSTGPAPIPPVEALSDAMPGHSRAFVQVQTGCDHRCTFCIIPFGRGESRSVTEADVVEAVRRIVGEGVPEVVLTGVDLTSWGHDLGDRRLGDLVKAILRGNPDLARLRLSSIDSIEADPALIDALATEERLMPHLHLSLQAGDDLILKRMKRRHSFADAVAFCTEIRRLCPDIVFGADIIAGFPTETEAMFDRSCALVDACGLTHLHVFPFSPRPGTPAARMPQVAPAVAKERARRLRLLGERRLAAHLDSQQGKRIEILTESGGNGRSADFTLVRLPDETAPRQFLTGRVSGHTGKALLVEDVRHVASRLVAAAAAG